MIISNISTKINFQSNSSKKEIKKCPDTISEPHKPERSGLSTTAKYMICATALAGTIAFGIIGHKNNWWRKAVQQSSELNNNEGEVLSELKQMTMDKFKEVGAFVKGKAKLTNGEMYNGTIIKQNPNGTTVTLEYESGFLKKSSISDGEKFMKTKEYKYDENGKLIQAGKAKFSYHTDTGKISRIELPFHGNPRTIICDKNGRVKYINRYKIVPMHADDTDIATVEFDTITGKPKRAYMRGGHINIYDKNGNPTHRIKTAPGFSKKDILNNARLDDFLGNMEVTCIDYNNSDYKLVFNKFYHIESDTISPTIIITNHKTRARFIFERGNGAWGIDGRLKNGHKFGLTQDGDIANLIIDNLDAKKVCAKYNIKTQKIEILPEFKDSAAEINEVFNEISSAAKNAKRIIRGFNRYNKERNEFINTLRNNGLFV